MLVVTCLDFMCGKSGSVGYSARGPQWCQGRCLSEAFYDLAGFISWLEHFHRLPLAMPEAPACGFLIFLPLKTTVFAWRKAGAQGRVLLLCFLPILRWKFLLFLSALCTDLLQERSGWGRLPLAPSLSRSRSAAATKFYSRERKYRSNASEDT